MRIQRRCALWRIRSKIVVVDTKSREVSHIFRPPFILEATAKTNPLSCPGILKYKKTWLVTFIVAFGINKCKGKNTEKTQKVHKFVRLLIDGGVSLCYSRRVERDLALFFVQKNGNKRHAEVERNAYKDYFSMYRVQKS